MDQSCWASCHFDFVNPRDLAIYQFIDRQIKQFNYVPVIPSSQAIKQGFEEE